LPRRPERPEPRDRVVLRAGEGHVELAEIFSARLEARQVLVIGALRPGQTARIELVGVPALTGRVRLLPAEVDRVSRLGRMRIALPADTALQVGRFARGSIEVGRRRAVALPLSAVRLDQSRATVQLVVDGRIAARAVTLGAVTGGRIEIRDGLAGGETLVLRAGAFLRDGDAVNAVPATAGRGP